MASRRQPRSYIPSPEFQAAMPDASGNVINGLGERTKRRASPMFWHPADQHPFGAVQALAAASCRVSDEARDAFADTIAEPNVIVLGVSHDWEKLRQVPSTKENGTGIAEVGRQYARGTRTAFAVANWIRRRGYEAHAFPGPRAAALLLIPAAIDAGLGELGKHGSLINRIYGSNLRLAGVTTDMPIETFDRDLFGADDFCTNCRVCSDACPPDAINDSKQWVRGVERWYVDFDKCIPFFADNAGCGACIAACPWARPGLAENLLVKMARRQAVADAAAKED